MSCVRSSWRRIGKPGRRCSHESVLLELRVDCVESVDDVGSKFFEIAGGWTRALGAILDYERRSGDFLAPSVTGRFGNGDEKSFERGDQLRGACLLVVHIGDERSVLTYPSDAVPRESIPTSGEGVGQVGAQPCAEEEPSALPT